MTFKANIATDARFFYVLENGDDNEAGTSLETAKETIQGAVDAVNALVPPPNALNRAVISVEGSGNFGENITLPNFTDVDAIRSSNTVPTGTNYTLGSFAGYSFGLTANSGTSETVFSAANQTSLSLECSEINITGDGTTALAVSGTTDDSFFRISQLRLNGDGAIGVNYTASNGEPEVFIFASITLEDDNTVAFIHDPSVSTARSIFDVAGIGEIGSPLTTTGIRVIDGHVSAYVNEIIAGDALDVQGGELSIMSNCITGDITVALGATLVCEIAEFTGVLTNNGTITGRIGDQYFTAGVVTTSDTLTNNTLIVGNGGVDVDNRENATLTDNGTTLTLNLNSPIASTGTSRLLLNDSTGSLKGELEYLENTDEVTWLFTTSQFTIGAGPSASQIEFLGNDTELRYQTGGTSNAFTIDMTAGPDTNAPFIIDNGGTNGGVVNFFVGDRNPEGNVSADPGSIYYRIDGVDSRTFQHEGASTGTAGWVANEGNIDGPVSSTNTAIARWSGTGGDTLLDSANALLVQSATESIIDLTSPNGTNGITGIDFFDSTATQTGRFAYSDTTGQFFLSNLTDLPMQFSFTQDGGSLFLLGLAHTDSDRILNLTTSSTNGGSTSFLVGGRNPEGLVTANPGDIYFREDGVDSDIYIHRSAASSNTDWVDVFAGSVDGPATSVNNALPTWNGTTGLLLNSIGNALLVDDSTDITLSLQNPLITGSTFFTMLDSTSAEAFRIEHDEGSSVSIECSVGQFNIGHPPGFGASGTTITGDDILFDLEESFSSVTFNASHGDTAPLFVMTTGGANGELTEFFVGDRSPEGIVSTQPGDIYYRNSGVTSTMYIHRAAGSGNTGWSPTVTTDGSASTTDGLAYFTDTNGIEIAASSQATLVENGNNIELGLIPLSAAGQSDLFFYDETGSGIVGTLRHNLSSGDLLLEDFTAGNLLFSCNGSSTLTMTGAGRTFLVDGTATSDTVSLFTLDTGGTNGAVTDIHVGTRNPDGLVNADPGSLYFRSSGVDSDIYIHRAASAGTTGWVDVLSTGLKTNLASNTNEAMCIWDGTDASTLTQDALILSVSSASAGALEILSPSVSGFAGITFEDSTSTTVFDILFSETNNATTIESGNGGDLDLVSAGQMNVNTADDIIISANSNANSVTINADFIFNGTGAGAEFDIECPAADEFAFIQFQNNASAARMQIGYDQDVDVASIQTFQTSTDFLLRSEDHAIELNVNATDDSQSVRISNTQNGFDIWSREADPQGSISGVNGDIVVAANGFADTFIFLNKGSTSNTSWAIVELQQKVFEFVNTTSTLSQSHNRILLNPNAGDIVLSLPTAGTASRQNGFEQTLTKTITNTDVITIDTPGFYGHTGNFVMSKRGDYVTYMQDNSANVILGTNRNVFASIRRTFGNGETSIAGFTGADIVLTIFTTNEHSYEGLCEPDQANDSIVFPDVENLTDGDLYKMELLVVVRGTANDEIRFQLAVDDSGITTVFELGIEHQFVTAPDEVTLYGYAYIRTGTNDSVLLDTSVLVEFTLPTGATAFFQAATLTATRVEGR